MGRRKHDYEPGWYIFCEEYECGPYPTWDDAVRDRRSFESAGLCRLEHHIKYRSGREFPNGRYVSWSTEKYA